MSDIVLQVAGFQAMSTVDWPDQLTSVVFLAGCSWRCGYCHNHSLRKAADCELLNWKRVLLELKKRSAFLDGVVFSGGEPLLHKHLYDAIQQVKGLGLRIGLHTSGMNPKQLELCLPLLDWVGLDIKHTPDGYAHLTGDVAAWSKVERSLSILSESHVMLECRTTLSQQFMSLKDLDDIADILLQYDVQSWALQAANLIDCLDANWRGQPVDMQRYQVCFARYQKLFTQFTVRS